MGISIGVPKNRWSLMEHPNQKMDDDWGYPHDSGNPQVGIPSQPGSTQHLLLLRFRLLGRPQFLYHRQQLRKTLAVRCQQGTCEAETKQGEGWKKKHMDLEVAKKEWVHIVAYS